MNQKSIYDLELHEIVEVYNILNTATVVRVPGGWLYTLTDSTNPTTTFVPYNEEFKSMTMKEWGVDREEF